MAMRVLRARVAGLHEQKTRSELSSARVEQMVRPNPHPNPHPNPNPHPDPNLTLTLTLS